MLKNGRNHEFGIFSNVHFICTILSYFLIFLFSFFYFYFFIVYKGNLCHTLHIYVYIMFEHH